MKKMISLVITLVLVATVFYGCSDDTVQSSEQNTNVTSNVLSNENDSQPSTDKKEIDLSIFPEVKASSENINVYREEISKRRASLGENKSFISDEEWKVISNSEHFTGIKSRQYNCLTIFSETTVELSNYFYPVVFKDGDMLVLWYTTEAGKLYFEKLHGNGRIENSLGGQLHMDISDSVEVIITSKPAYTTTYVQETGEFKVWKFGEVADTCSVPKNSIYCGLSYFEGYIFRNGTDVYTINAIGSQTTDGSVECIAHNVKYVIDADYYYGSDPWCQPLFIMKDGSIKCYISWEGERNSASDDISHLCDLQHEGSYDK